MTRCSRGQLWLQSVIHWNGRSNINPSLTVAGPRITTMSLTSAELQPQAVESVETFSLKGASLRRHVLLRTGERATSSEGTASALRSTGDLSARFYSAWLRRNRAIEEAGSPVTVADLFSGCGGLSVGAHEAARATGRRAVHVLAADSNEDSLQVFGDNFAEAYLHSGPIEELLDGELGDRLTQRERRLAQRFGGLDLAMGGPPCQGHSDLNNHTRREDPRNALYLRMARFVEVVRPRLALIENVPGVAHDKLGVVQRTQEALVAAGYLVDTGVLTATDFGASQARRRHFLVASRDRDVVPNLRETLAHFGAPPGTVSDAIDDLGLEPSRGTFGTSARHSVANQSRINYMFANGVWDLPDSERPDCHRLKPHSYRSVYGRMRGDQPAPTITSGFGSTGQGRFVHPREPRTLTPHEAARLQGFPDWFSFEGVSGRRALQQMIGNAVPSRLAYAALAGLLR